MLPDDWHATDERFSAQSDRPVVIQFSTDACIHCPDATLKIDAVHKTHQFSWHLDDAIANDLAEELGVCQLPAILVFHSAQRYKLYQKLRGDDATRILHAECPLRLQGADF